VRAPFPELVERHQQRTYRAAYRVLGERQAALDVTQDALLALHRRRASVPDERAGPWLARVATHRALDLVRRREVEARARATLATPAAASPVEALERAEEAARALASLAQLSPRQREVVALRALEGLPFTEIAAALGISEGATKVHFARGLRALRARLPGVDPKLSGGPT